jgi:hypothetical protein
MGHVEVSGYDPRNSLRSDWGWEGEVERISDILERLLLVSVNAEVKITESLVIDFGWTPRLWHVFVITSELLPPHKD